MGCGSTHAVGRIPPLSLPDLVKAKKTQRDKDWQQDRLYWAPLRSELERGRRSRPR
jgi:hypothetical protein